MNIKNKIVCLVLSIFLFSVFSPCYADFQPNSNRWLWIGSDDKMGVWFDSESVYEHQEYGRTLVYIWTLFYHNTPREYIEKIQFNLDLEERSLGVSEYIKQDMNGNVLDVATAENSTRGSIVPGTYGEALYNAAKRYHELHNHLGAIR